MTYVSDVLEDLLDAGATRARVVEVCNALLDPLPPEEARSLRPTLVYYGGKCMGYPAIWCVSAALGLEADTERELIDRVRATLFANITTSIVDDMFDGDEQVGVEHLAALYLFIYGAMAAAEWDAAFAPAAMATFRKALNSAKLRATGQESREMVRIRGARIGAFFGLTGKACGRALGLDPDVEARIVALLEDFGAVCGHIDDLLDLEADLAHGDYTNVVAVALRAHGDHKREDYGAILRSPAGMQRTGQFLESEFEALACQADQAGWPDLASQFRTAGIGVLDAVMPLEDIRCASN